MTSLPINLIPAEILKRFNADQMVLICNEDLGRSVFGSTTFDPSSLREVDGLESLSELRQREGVYSITSTILRLTRPVIDRATKGFEHRAGIVSELGALLEREEEVYVVYAVTHFNHKPLEELNVFIGGDCYRTGAEIRDLESVLSRTKDLARAMIRKSVIVFPDIPTLHGGKKGEWLIIDRFGKKIEKISEEAIVALGTLIIPEGIAFLNRYKEKRAIEKGIYQAFPDRNVMRPDTASPDVLSGPNWMVMCDRWAERGVNLSFVTCLPKHLGGPLVTSAHPTGYGVVAAALKLVGYRFPDGKRAEMRFLLEALGGVGQATIEALLEKGISPDRITAFDKSAEACKHVADKYGVSATASTHEDFYRSLDAGQKYDVWINNGEGANTLPEHVRKLLDCGVGLFCGAANNFLKLTDDKTSTSEDLRQRSLQMIFDAGAWAWPDEAASGGGWTLAVIDVLTRAKGERSSTTEAEQQIQKTIITRNEKLVDDVVRDVTTAGGAGGKAVWDRIGQLIDERVQSTLRKQFRPSEILAAADVTQWKLT
jgi:glutamate dehydrogenase/leucine dehydrogenase